MSETPRTDAEVVKRNYGHDMIPADFARQLERELDGLAAMYRTAVKQIEDTSRPEGEALNAARYRWLRREGTLQNDIAMTFAEHELDRAIDQEIAKENARLGMNSGRT